MNFTLGRAEGYASDDGGSMAVPSIDFGGGRSLGSGEAQQPPWPACPDVTAGHAGPRLLAAAKPLSPTTHIGLPGRSSSKPGAIGASCAWPGTSAKATAQP